MHVHGRPPRRGFLSHVDVCVDDFLWLSQGPRFVGIPDVTGRPVREARLALSDAGLPAARVVSVEHLRPEGTVVAQDPYAIGRAAAELLFARLDGYAGPSEHRTISTRLVIRGSGEIRPSES